MCRLRTILCLSTIVNACFFVHFEGVNNWFPQSSNGALRNFFGQTGRRPPKSDRARTPIIINMSSYPIQRFQILHSVNPSLPIVNFVENGQSISFSSFFEGIPLQFVKHFTNTGYVVISSSASLHHFYFLYIFLVWGSHAAEENSSNGRTKLLSATDVRLGELILRFLLKKLSDWFPLCVMFAICRSPPKVWGTLLSPRFRELCHVGCNYELLGSAYEWPVGHGIYYSSHSSNFLGSFWSLSVSTGDRIVRYNGESSAKRRIVETNFSGKLLMYGKKGMSPRLSLKGLLTQHMYNFNDHHLWQLVGFDL